jgi:hypothetical protein
LQRTVELYVHGIDAPRQVMVNQKPFADWVVEEGGGGLLLPAVKWNGGRLWVEVKR